MADSPLELQLLKALETEAATHGIDVVDVEVTGAARAPVVRIRIDHADETLPTITLDEVGEQSAWVGEVVERVDPFPGEYLLEVSSPGMDRPLRRPHDFERFAGETVSLTSTATEGRRRYTGALLGMADGRVALSCDDGEFSFDLAEVRSCRIKPDYAAAARVARRGSE